MDTSALQNTIKNWGASTTNVTNPWMQTTTDQVSNAVPGSALNFLGSNPTVSQNEFQDITGVKTTPGGITEQFPASIIGRLTDILSPTTPSFISTILGNYKNEGETALGQVAAPTNKAVSTQGYNNAAANAGQVNAQGTVNTPGAVTDYNATQNANYESAYSNYQSTQKSVESALQSLSDPGTAQATTLAFTTNAINEVLNQAGGVVDPASIQNIYNSVQNNLSSFTQFNSQMQQVFENYLKLSYNLPSDITNAMWANNATPGLIGETQMPQPAAATPSTAPTMVSGGGE